LALDGDEWSASHPGCFNPREKVPVPTGEEAGWATEPVSMQWQRENTQSLPETEPL